MAKFTHRTIEKNSILLLVLILVVVATGGLIEIVPLFWIKSTIETVEGVRPYTPLELAGRTVYVREGCYYSLAAESKYAHPFQWGSKRTGPDLARLGGKYSDEWHQLHMADPRSVVPESVMPGYPFLAETALDTSTIAQVLRANAAVGVPYDDQMIAEARSDLTAQANPDADPSGLRARYGEAVKARDFDGDPDRLTELDALIAYMQMLGTMVDFDAYEATAGDNER